MKIKRLATGFLLAVMLFSWLSPVVYAAEEEFRYALSIEHFHPFCEVEINGGAVDLSDSRIVLDEKDRVNITISLKEDTAYIESGSRFFRFSSTEDGSISTTYSRRDVLLLPDGSYAALRPKGETLVFEDLHLAEDRSSLNYSFHFDGEYEAVPVTYEEIRNAKENDSDTAEGLWSEIDTTNPYRLRIRAGGRTLAPASLGRELSEEGLHWSYALLGSNGLDATYEINTGDGWLSLDVASWKNEKDDREDLYNGKNFVYESYRFIFSTAYGEATTYELSGHIAPESVAVTAAAAAVGALVISSAVNATSSGTASSSSSPKPSILINGGGVYPSLANTQKATVELLLNMDNSFGQIYKWVAIATSPECVKAVTAAAIPPYGESSTAVVMISGQNLPKNKISVFLEIIAIGLDGERITASAELPLYEKGLFAQLKDPEHPELAESYEVTKVSDANIDGLAEIKTLTEKDFRVEYQNNRATIYAGDETVAIEL